MMAASAARSIRLPRPASEMRSPRSAVILGAVSRPPRIMGAEVADAPPLRDRPRRLLALPRRRRLGDRKPHRAIRADGDVSVLHRADLVGGHPVRLGRPRRSGGAIVALDLAGGGG